MARKKSRRARGTGSIFWHKGRQRWVGRAVVGHKQPGGEPIYAECSGRTQAEVVERMRLAAPPGPEVTVAGWVAHWWPTVTSRRNTRKNYRQLLDNHVLPQLGHLRLSAVNAVTVEAMAARLREALEPSTVAVALAVTRLVFQAAVRSGVIPANPVAAARKPKLPRVRVDTYTPAELVQIIEAADWYAGGRVLALLAATGCRVGEAIALDVPDFDQAAGTIRITKTAHPDRGTGPPKSENGVRTIRVPAAALPALQAAVGGRKDGPLFVTGAGRRTIHRNISDALKRTLRALGLPHRRGHVLRHSVATHLVAAGVPIPDVAKYLGDSPITIMRVYAHPTDADPADALDRLYGGDKVGAGRDMKRKAR